MITPTFPTQNLILILFYIKINCNIVTTQVQEHG